MRFRSWLQQLVPEINASNRNVNNLENLQKQKGGKLPAEVPLHAKLFFARAVQAGSYEQITIIHHLTTIDVSGKLAQDCGFGQLAAPLHSSPLPQR